MTRRLRKTNRTVDAMNFIVAMCKILYRSASRNKVIVVLVTAASVAAVMVYMSNSRVSEKGLHQDIGSLRGDMKAMANSLQSLQAKMSELGSHEHKQGTEMTYWLSSKDVSCLQSDVFGGQHVNAMTHYTHAYVQPHISL